MRDVTEKNLSRILFDTVDLGIALLDCDQSRDRLECLAGVSDGDFRRGGGRAGLLEDLFPQIGVNQLALAVAASLESGTSRLLSHSLHPALLPLKTRSGQDMIHDVTVRAVDYAPARYCLIQVSDVSVRGQTRTAAARTAECALRRGGRQRAGRHPHAR